MARFKPSVTCYIHLVLTSFSMVFASRLPDVSLSHQCVSMESSPVDKLPVVLLHGLTGFKEAWGHIYQVIPLLTQRRVCVYDARNHGDSDWSDTFDVDILAEDLGNFMTDMGIEKAALVGHSMGGLTVMKFALKNPGRVESIFVEDISPKEIPKDIAENIKAMLKLMLDGLTVIPDDADEKSARKALKDYISNVTIEGIPEYPLRCRNGVWKFKSNFEVFAKAFEDVDSWFGKFEGLYHGRAFFIYGEDSPFKVNEDEGFIRKLFPKAQFFGVAGADHVINTHNPIYLNTLIEFLNHKEL